MTDLLANLKAAIDEDERIARAAAPAPWCVNDTSDLHLLHDANDGELAETACWLGERYRATYDHFARHDPARVLRQVEAHRKILELHPHARLPTDPPEYVCETCEPLEATRTACGTVMALAEVYGIGGES